MKYEVKTEYGSYFFDNIENAEHEFGYQMSKCCGVMLIKHNLDGRTEILKRFWR